MSGGAVVRLAYNCSEVVLRRAGRAHHLTHAYINQQYRFRFDWVKSISPVSKFRQLEIFFWQVLIQLWVVIFKFYRTCVNGVFLIDFRYIMPKRKEEHSSRRVTMGRTRKKGNFTMTVMTMTITTILSKVGKSFSIDMK